MAFYFPNESDIQKYRNLRASIIILLSTYDTSSSSSNKPIGTVNSMVSPNLRWDTVARGIKSCTVHYSPLFYSSKHSWSWERPLLAMQLSLQNHQSQQSSLLWHCFLSCARVEPRPNSRTKLWELRIIYFTLWSAWSKTNFGNTLPQWRRGRSDCIESGLNCLTGKRRKTLFTLLGTFFSEPIHISRTWARQCKLLKTTLFSSRRTRDGPAFSPL